MRFEGSVDYVRDVGEDIEVSLTNVRRLSAASWRQYSNAITFKAPDTQAKTFLVGRRIRVEIIPL